MFAYKKICALVRIIVNIDLLMKTMSCNPKNKYCAGDGMPHVDGDGSWLDSGAM